MVVSAAEEFKRYEGENLLPPIRCGVSVMWYGPRYDLAMRLVERLREYAPYLGISPDEVGDTEDERGTKRGGGCWYNAKQSWALANPEYDWHMILTDDAMLCREWGPIAGIALRSFIMGVGSVMGVQPFTFFTTHSTVENAVNKGHAWIRLGKGMWGQQQTLPTSWVKPMVKWGDAYWRHDVPHDDARMNLWLMLHGIYTWCSVPSLTDHDIEEKSLVGRGDQIGGNLRKAHIFADSWMSASKRSMLAEPGYWLGGLPAGGQESYVERASVRGYAPLNQLLPGWDEEKNRGKAPVQVPYCMKIGWKPGKD